MVPNWSAIDSRSVLGRLLRLPLAMLPRGTLVTVRKGPAKGLKWIVGSANHGCWLGTYELQKQSALLRFVRGGMTIYDIGAQAGFYTLFFSRLVGSAGQVYAFEPCPYEARHLIDHVRINRLSNVKIIQAAVYDRSGLNGFTTDRPQTENSVTSPDRTTLCVPALRLDDVRLPPAALIKIDVEGAEAAVLAGAAHMLHVGRPVVFVALHGPEARRACKAALEQAGYAIHDLAGNQIMGDPQTDEIYALPARS